MLSKIWKPWFICRPTQLLRRLMVSFHKWPTGYTSLETSWGTNVIADPRLVIGRSIFTTGLYDIAVSEALFRLIEPGDCVVDAGANVGYMTLLASVASGPKGKVISFEPHPKLFEVLQKNVSEIKKKANAAAIIIHNEALGEVQGTAELSLPQDFEGNDGVATLVKPTTRGGMCIEVSVSTLDEKLQDQLVHLMKMDVEGFEPNVLKGAKQALESGRIKNIVLEDHSIHNSEVVRILRDANYQLFSLGWSIRGPLLDSIDAKSLAARYEAPNYIATLEPENVVARFRRKGWLSLSNR